MNKDPFLSLEEREEYEENIFLHLNARISTLEALLRDVKNNSFKSYYFNNCESHVCCFCDAKHFDQNCIEHRYYCPVILIQKELGEG